MKVEVNPELKPLYANLLRLGIGKYLISERFNQLCIENNIDQLWDRCVKDVYVKDVQENTVIPAYPEYTKDEEKALAVFLMELYKSKERFLKILSKILFDFEECCDKEIDFSKVIDALLQLGYSEDEIKHIIHKTRKETLKDIPPQKVPELKAKEEEIDEKLCFVIMPFDEKFSPIYKKITKVVEDLNLKCIRSDEIYSTKPVIEDIRKSIQKARILIADLTERNPNVMYEVGFAHAINKKVILITQKLEDVPFDLRHYRCIVYKDSISGGEKLQYELRNTLKRELGET